MNNQVVNGWQCPICKTVYSPMVTNCSCSINKQEDVKEKNTAQWKTWGGWSGNHDQRIEQSECTNCGYKHPTVYRSLDNLSKHCSHCGYEMIGVIEF